MGRGVSPAEEPFDLIWPDSSPEFSQILAGMISGLSCESMCDTSCEGAEKMISWTIYCDGLLGHNVTVPVRETEVQCGTKLQKMKLCEVSLKVLRQTKRAVMFVLQ